MAWLRVVNELTTEFNSQLTFVFFFALVGVYFPFPGNNRCFLEARWSNDWARDFVLIVFLVKAIDSHSTFLHQANGYLSGVT